MLESLDALISKAFTKIQEMEQDFADCAPELLLMVIAMELDDIRTRSIARPYQILPLSIATSQPTAILDVDTQGLPRRCILMLDAFTSGPIPTVRVHTSRSVNAAAGGQGIPVQVGQANDLGVVDGGSQLFAIASGTGVTGSLVSFSP